MKKIMNFPHTEVEQKLEDNDVIAGLTVIFTPGHSAGSICLYDPVRKALFSGDTLLGSKGKITGPRSAVTPDMDTAWASVEKLKELDIEVVLPGHGEPIKNDATNQVPCIKTSGKIVVKKTLIQFFRFFHDFLTNFLYKPHKDSQNNSKTNCKN